MEDLPGEDVLALRRAVPQIMRILATNDQTSEIWKTVRLAAGVPAVKGGNERPSPIEFNQIRYVLETHCMACGDCPAYRQWVFGFRLCSSCLTPRVTTFHDFREEHSDLTNEWGNLREAIPWVVTSSVPGLVGVAGSLVARKTWADQVAQNLKSSIWRKTPKQIEKEKEEISSSILAGLQASRTFATVSHSAWPKYLNGSLRFNPMFKSLAPLRPTRITNALTLDRLARQRQKWLTDRLLGVKSLKLVISDIPNMQVSDWRKILYKTSEPGTEDEWDERYTRLRLMVARRRNTRLAALLHRNVPPLPSDDSVGAQRTNQEITGLSVGRLPALVFLEICRFSDIKTVTRLEQVSSVACSILKSSAAESLWRHLRLAVGLEDCGSEGITVWVFAKTLCGKCFAEKVIRADQVLLHMSKEFKGAMPSLHAESCSSWGWFSSSPIGVRLFSRDYAQAVQDWISQIPDDIWEQLPQDFLAKHLDEWTAPFKE
ncbi:hypothetical protein FRC00_002358, partial [Tulasnella sp. 408]